MSALSIVLKSATPEVIGMSEVRTILGVISKLPPTADTLLYSNTTEESVPRITALLNVAVPSESIFHPVPRTEEV
jgi:hypothetical protein